MRATTFLAGILLVLAAAAAEARAAGYGTDDAGRLYEVWPDEPSAELLGTVSVTETRDGKRVTYTPTLTDIALSDLQGMYGISFTDLYRIDMRDPAKSVRVGSLTGSGGFFNALDFDAQGRLWALQHGGLYRVDLKTGKATAVGSLGAGFSSAGDLAWVGETLYASVDVGLRCHLVRVDPKTGKATDLGSFHQAPAARPAKEGGTPRPLRHVQDVWGLIWDGRRLFALTSQGELLEVDRKTARLKPLSRLRVTWYGSCPMLRI